MLEAIIIIAIVTLLITFLWRLSSHRYKIPCPTWLGWMVEMDNPFAKVHKAKMITENLSLEKGMTVIDIGCGPGRVTIPIAIEIGPSGRMIALDLQQGMLDKTKDKADALNLTNIEYLCAGLGEGKLDANIFDRATLVAVLGEIPDQESALKEVFRALKPGGVLSITETIFDPHYQRRVKVNQLVSSLGFKEKAFFGNTLAYTLNFEKPVTH